MEKNDDKAPKKQLKRYNCRVVCRLRPKSQRERDYEASNPNHDGASLTIVNDRAVSLTLSNDKPPYLFQFHKVIGPDTTAQEFFENIGKPAVHDMWCGVSHTILAYGETGSGKTHSIFGYEGREGLVPLCARYLFARINERPTEKMTVTCSFYDIYNEQITDVLTSKEELRVREDPVRGIYIEGLSEERVTSAAEFNEVMQRGWNNRLVKHTRMSEDSSRAHFLVHINLLREGHDSSATTSRLIFADLVGSERAQRSKFPEGRNIFKSLASLRNCVVALNSKEPHVPYRNSKLTFLLKTSLRGDNKTTFLATCSPHYARSKETLSTLRFGKVLYAPYLGTVVIELRTILNPTQRGLFDLLPAELVLAIAQYLTYDVLSHKQTVWLTTRLYRRQLPNKPSVELWQDLIECDKTTCK